MTPAMITSDLPLYRLQAYVAAKEVERQFDQQSARDKCLLLGEEVGELFKAVRKTSGLGVDPHSDVKTVGHELADILNFLLAIANRYDIDLGQAYVAKEKINQERRWISDRQA
jgi:NTP pyrophosphatase (non-canonical NTP hydrolase)